MSIMNNLSLIDFIYEKYEDFILNEENIPDLGFILFKTGKEMNSKTKFENWILFVDNSSKLSSSELKEILSKIYEAIRKFLTAGKAGEGGMKLNEENSYYPPTDTMNDIIKLLENIINETGANDKLYFGIDCNANNFYNESNNTYEMDGFKKPPETEELINFYVKLCQDHPLLKYLEDPLGDGDLMGWKKMLDKFKEEKPEVKICSKSLVLDDIQKLSAIIDKNEDEENDENNNENNNNNNNNENNNNNNNNENNNENNKKKKMRTTDPKYRSRLINNIPQPEDIVYEMTEKEKKKLAEEEARKKAEEEEKKRLEEEEEKNNKGKKKPPEPKKDNKKKEEENKPEENENKIISPLPLNLNNIALNFGNLKNINEFIEFIQKCKSHQLNLSVYDNIFETEQTCLIDILIAMRVNKIILHGYTNKQDKLLVAPKLIHLLIISFTTHPKNISKDLFFLIHFFIVS